MKTTINLLPASFQRQLIVRRRVYQWGVIVAASLIVGGIVRWNDVRAHQVLLQRLDLLTREHQPTQLMLRQLVDMRRELTELQQLEQIAQQLEYQRPVLALLGVLSDIGEKTEGRLRVTKLELTGLQQIDSAAKREPQGTAASGVVVTGVSLDNQSIAKLESGLWESGFFEHVELVKSTESTAEGSSLREYQVRCEL
jgi:hypothetical protein